MIPGSSHINSSWNRRLLISPPSMTSFYIYTSEKKQVKRCPPSHGARCSTSFSLPVCFTFLVVVVVAFTLSLLDYTMTTIRFYYYYNTSLVFSSRFQCLTAAAPRAKFENNSAPTSSLTTTLLYKSIQLALYNESGWCCCSALLSLYKTAPTPKKKAF